MATCVFAVESFETGRHMGRSRRYLKHFNVLQQKGQMVNGYKCDHSNKSYMQKEIKLNTSAQVLTTFKVIRWVASAIY